MAHVRVIGFSGKMGSGKSTAALLAKQHLMRITGEDWHVVAFGDALKVIVANMCETPLCLCYTDVGKAMVPPKSPRGLDPSMFGVDAGMPSLDVHTIDKMNEVIANSLSHDDKPATIGRMLQLVGQTVRTFEPDFWIDALEGTMDIDKNYIVEDVRYSNEFEWIRDSMLGIIGRINSSSQTNAKDGRDVVHFSETALDACTAWHFEIDNSPPYSSGKLMSQLAEKLAPFH
jgi:hypothetical protein